ncbi:MAG: type II toxin-antitoxin system RelE/ParE family toxin [Candidatus Hydrogenedentes bacterium]|nr:type II toxin-antitoxin system RelE/ParE family toxin [Candidatus Hydrogenedentota bacterium]
MSYTSSFSLSRQAANDIESIRDFIASDKPRAAERFITRLLQQCRMLSQNPSIGRNRNEITQGLRSFPIARYVIYYRETGTHTIEIIRVLHAARDAEVSFPEE